MKSLSIIAVTLLSALMVGACTETATGPSSNELSAQNTLSASQAAPKKGDDPIAAIAINAGFDELVAALSYVDTELGAGLVDLFMYGTDQYTVFAPTDDAFEDLYTLLSSVLNTEIDEITDLPAEIVLDVLLYHVTDGRRAANSVVPKKNEKTVETLLEEMFYVRPDLTIRDGLTGLRDDAMIDTPNISASNGIIHVITQVIVPPSVVAAITG